MTKKFLTIFTLVFFSLAAKCQNPVFSQYYASGLYLNPALAGLEKDTYLGMNYRTQWSNINLPFSTFQCSFIAPVMRPGVRKKHLGGFGVSFLSDVAGTNREFSTQSVTITGAHNLHLNKHGNNIISLALQAGMVQQRFNYSDLRWSSQYSAFTGYDVTAPGETGNLNQQLFHPLLNAGAMWYFTNKQRNMSNYSTSIYNGLSISNLLPYNSFFPGDKSYTSFLYKIHGGWNTTYSRRIELSPNYLIQLQDHHVQVNLGMYTGYTIIAPRGNSRTGATKLLAGVWYRLQDAFIVSTGISNDLWNFGFSYDSNVFSLSRAFGYGNAYEVSMAYKIPGRNAFKRFSSPLI